MARLKSINFPNTEGELSTLFDKLQRSTLNTLLVSGALAIHGASSPLAKTAQTAYAIAGDTTLVKLAAADLPALVGTVVNAMFNVFVFTVNAAGTTKTYMGTAGATLGAVVFPTFLDGEVPLGFVIINPTGTGNFVGGTTNLDDGTVVPNAVYINTVGEFFPFYSTL